MQVTWNSALSGVSWNSPGGDFTTTPAVVATGAYKPPVWETFEITQLIKDFLNDPAKNFGFLILVPTSNDGDWRDYQSSEYSTQAQRPKLVITYDATSILTDKTKYQMPSDRYTVTVFDIKGRAVVQGNINTLKELESIQASLSSGVHIIELRSISMHLMTKRCLINK